MKLKAIVAVYVVALVSVAIYAWLTVAPEPTPAKENLSQYQFLYFGASWCEPCQRMKANTLNNAAVKKYMNDKFGLYVTIMDIDVFRKMADVYNITSVPTYIILDGNKEVKRGTGYLSPAQFLEWLK